jgi:hypothetical protein
MMPPLVLLDFPTVGPTGRRDNVRRLYELHSALLPHRLRLVLDVAHDDACPSGNGTDAASGCTCATVDVTLHATDPGES